MRKIFVYTLYFFGLLLLLTSKVFAVELCTDRTSGSCIIKSDCDAKPGFSFTTDPNEVSCYGMGQGSPPIGCCYDARPSCTPEYVCVDLAKCTDIIDTRSCGGSDVTCCEKDPQNTCDCIYNGGSCLTEPGGRFKIPTSVYLCDDCGSELNCYLPEISDKYCSGASVACYDACPSGWNNLGTQGCNNQFCCENPGGGPIDPPDPNKPPEMIYKGPIIETLEEILGPVTKMLYYGGLAIGAFFIILAGYKLMVSEGDPQRTKAAQEQLTSAIIGIIFILLSVTIIRVIIDEIINM